MILSQVILNSGESPMSRRPLMIQLVYTVMEVFEKTHLFHVFSGI